MYEIKIKAEADQPNTDNVTCWQWNTVSKRKTWQAAKHMFNSWVASHGSTHSVEVYWVGKDLTPTGKPRSHQHRLHSADCLHPGRDLDDYYSPLGQP